MLSKSIRLSIFDAESRGETVNRDNSGINNKDNIEREKVEKVEDIDNRVLLLKKEDNPLL